MHTYVYTYIHIVYMEVSVLFPCKIWNPSVSPYEAPYEAPHGAAHGAQCGAAYGVPHRTPTAATYETPYEARFGLPDREGLFVSFIMETNGDWHIYIYICMK